MYSNITKNFHFRNLKLLYYYYCYYYYYYFWSQLEIYVIFICKPAHLIKRAYTMWMTAIKYRNAVWACKEASIYFSEGPKALSYAPKDANAVRGAVHVLLQDGQDFFLTGYQHVCAYLVNKYLINKCMLFKHWSFWWTTMFFTSCGSELPRRWSHHWFRPVSVLRHSTVTAAHGGFAFNWAGWEFDKIGSNPTQMILSVVPTDTSCLSLPLILVQTLLNIFL